MWPRARPQARRSRVIGYVYRPQSDRTARNAAQPHTKGRKGPRALRRPAGNFEGIYALNAAGTLAFPRPRAGFGRKLPFY